MNFDYRILAIINGYLQIYDLKAIRKSKLEVINDNKK